MNITLIDRPSCFAMLLAVIAVLLLSSFPAADGDLWWQMAYGKFLLDNRTLIPDHSVFSWTDASNAEIYCAWIAEITLYLIYESLGLKGLFALRYFVMLLPACLLFWLARRDQSHPSALIWLMFLISYLMAYTSGGLLKPELFSFMFMALTVANYFAIKGGGPDASKLSYAFPVLILVWVNTHGGFVIGMIFLGVAAIGEVVNSFVGSKSNALETNTVKHLAIAAMLSIVAMFCTPYGWDYPLGLIEASLSLNQHHLGTVVAYHSIFAKNMAHLFHPLYLYLSVLLLLPLIIEQLVRRRLDFAVLFIIVVFAVLYIRYGRMTYFYAIVMLFSFQYLVRQSAMVMWLSNWSKLKSNSTWLIVVLIAALVTHRTLDRVLYPSRGNSFDFGVSSVNPVSEAEYIHENFSESKLCNSYTGGGYLIWRLWPKQKVMIDPRYFPFKSWYGEWTKLITSDTTRLLPNYDCDIWLVNYGYKNLHRGLRQSADWQLVFVGMSSAVYARKSNSITQHSVEVGEDLWTGTEANAIINALNLLINNKEYKVASKLSSSVEMRFRGRGYQQRVGRAVAYTRGTIAYYKHDYGQAYQLIRESQQAPAAVKNPNLLIRTNQFLTYQLWERGLYKDARDIALDGVESNPKYAPILFNAGTLLLANPRKDIDANLWEQYLSDFIRISEKNISSVPANYIDLAKRIVKARNVNISTFSPLRPTHKPVKLDALSVYY